jgi:Raf kinase inhibitor-like YbhB/YbcL family protein
MPTLERTVPPDPYALLPPVPSFRLSSDDIVEGGTLGSDFTHHSIGGANVSPHLRWSGQPDGTRGFVVTCFDPDAPTGSGFWHWVLVGLPAENTELRHGAGRPGDVPAGAFHVRNDYGTSDYGGAAPPAGDRPHRYIFAVHALDTEDLGLDPAVSPAYVGFNVTFHILARATLTAMYRNV